MRKSCALLIHAIGAALFALTAVPAEAGRFVATGHDADLHCAAQNQQCHFLQVAVNYVRAGAPTPSLPVLVLDNSPSVVDQALTKVFGTSFPRVVVDPGTPTGAQTPAFAATAITTSNFSAVIVASDITCGGCTLNTFTATPDSDAINSRKADFTAFFNAGGGIFALAGADHGDGSAADDVYYKFLPLPVGGVSVNEPFTLTPDGIALGLHDSPNGIGTNDDINCCPTHNSFTEPPLSSAIKVAERDATGAPETIFAEGIIIDGGIVPPCFKRLSQQIFCPTDGSGQFTFQFLFQNLTGGPVSHLTFLNLPLGVTVTPNPVNFPAVPNNGFKSVTVKITGTPGAVISFSLALHNADFSECCDQPYTIELPRCECAQIISARGPSCFPFPPPFVYTFTVQNLASTPVNFLLLSPTAPSLNLTLTPSVVSGLSLAAVPYTGTAGNTTQTVQISGADAIGGRQACFLISLHDGNLDHCCSIQKCVTLPVCDDFWDPLGDAELTFTTTALFIRGIGSSGLDGVRANLGGAESFRLGWRPLDPSGTLPQGAALTVSTTGKVAGEAGRELGSMGLEKEGAGLTITPDFLPIESPTHRLEVYRDGRLVEARPEQSGAVQVLAAPAQLWPTAVAKLDGIGGGTSCYSGEWKDDVVFRLPGGSELVGDELRLLAESPLRIESLATFSLRAARIPEIAIVEADAFHDCNGNGVTDAEDIASGASQDEDHDGVPDECRATSNDLVASLNTGFDEEAGQLLPAGTADDDWRVTAPSPQLAKVVIHPVAAWPAPLPQSAWISVDPERGQSLPGVARLRFERCFCLGAAAHQVEIDLDLRADDRATVLLNGQQIAGPGGRFTAPVPLSVRFRGVVGEEPLRTGENCLAVSVADSGGQVTGFDAAGAVRAPGGVCSANP
jgi:hypothetical protein